MDDTKRVVGIGVGIILVIAVAVGIYLIVVRRPGAKPAMETPVAATGAVATEGPEAGAIAPLDLPNLELDKSDDLLRSLVRDISSYPVLESWMKTRELVRKFVAAVDNIANGLSPRAQVDFFTPRGPFKVLRRDGAFVPDPSSFSRYDPVADAFISLDARASARLYVSLKPLFQEAYRELGYPDEDFHATLTRAVAELLATPVVEGGVILEKEVASYALADTELEGMSPAQKHLFRMGPENVQVIQTKLRALAIACGIPEYRLPKARSYAPAEPPTTN
jgi:hypothetical protein